MSKRAARRLNDAAVLTRLRMALASGDEPTKAIQVLEAANAREPDNGLAHLLIAVALFDSRRDIDTVIAHARRAVLLRPYDAAALVMLSRALAVGGHLEEAAGLVERALAINPDDADGRELQRFIADREGVTLGRADVWSRLLVDEELSE